MFKKLQIQLHLTHLKGNIFRCLKKFTFNDRFDYRFVYPTNHDAVCYITKTFEQNQFSISEAIKQPLSDSIIIELKQ